MMKMVDIDIGGIEARVLGPHVWYGTLRDLWNDLHPDTPVLSRPGLDYAMIEPGREGVLNPGQSIEVEHGMRFTFDSYYREATAVGMTS